MTAPPALRGLLAGDRGRLLAGLLAAEFGTAVQVTAAATVLPLASRDLHGAALYGAAVGGPSFASIVLVVLAPGVAVRLGPRATYAAATLAYAAGIALAALAPVMALVLAGGLLQGAASGLFAAFGLSAIGGLYEDRVRPRVLGLFALMWLLPSLLGPVVNAAIATAFGWRPAIAWPALLVIAARIVIGARIGMLPRARPGARAPLAPCAAVLAGLAATAAAPSLCTVLGLPGAIALFVAGLVVSALASVAVVGAFTGVTRAAVVVLFGALDVSFFAGESVLSLGMIDVAGVGVAGAAVAYAAGGIGWSLLGLRTPKGLLRERAAPIGTAAVAVGAVAAALLTLAGAQGWPALVAATAAWAVAGIGMGVGYPVLSAAAFDDAPEQSVPRIAAAVAFVEFAGAGLAGQVGGGVYALASALPPAAAVGSGWIAAAAVATATALAALIRTRSPGR